MRVLLVVLVLGLWGFGCSGFVGGGVGLRIKELDGVWVRVSRLSGSCLELKIFMVIDTFNSGT